MKRYAIDAFEIDLYNQYVKSSIDEVDIKQIDSVTITMAKSSIVSNIFISLWEEGLVYDTLDINRPYLLEYIAYKDVASLDVRKVHYNIVKRPPIEDNWPAVAMRDFPNTLPNRYSNVDTRGTTTDRFSNQLREANLVSRYLINPHYPGTNIHKP